jgi:hypothetical protein
MGRGGKVTMSQFPDFPRVFRVGWDTADTYDTYGGFLKWGYPSHHPFEII